ncbi:hypothetical protein [Sphingomonas crusticola]|jgi:hypothetical protein|uniref:hypothetical protein n=1 Tax=Sphingomonas crusticola TaxID=1697973 RepID=UPI000E23D4D4|nr:hypothetical protein [Sphingomonas crusticola]
MPTSLRIMAILGALIGVIGLPVLLRPHATRVTLGLKKSPQMVYILRIVGTMLTALGLVLIVFAITFWKTA